MKIEYLVNQAKKYLPLLSNNFTDNVKINSLSVVDGIFTLNTDKIENVKKNEDAVVFIKNIPIKVNIKSIEKISPNEAILITKNNHNTTKNPSKLNKVYINIQGCSDNEYNGEIEVLEDYQDGGFKLRIRTTYEATKNPNVENAFFYIHNFYKTSGIKKVKVIDQNTISFDSNDKTLNYEVNDKDDMLICMNTRIYPAYDFEDAASQFNRSRQIALKNRGITNIEEAEVTLKESKEYTAFISLDPNVKNTASNNTSIGRYSYNFSVFIFILNREGENYLVRNIQDELLHKIFNKIFGEKIITLKDKMPGVNMTDKIYFTGAKLADQRYRDLSVYELQYSFSIQTFDENYKLPIEDVRLNCVDMEITNRDSDNYSNLHVLL